MEKGQDKISLLFPTHIRACQCLLMEYTLKHVFHFIKLICLAYLTFFVLLCFVRNKFAFSSVQKLMVPLQSGPPGCGTQEIRKAALSVYKSVTNKHVKLKQSHLKSIKSLTTFLNCHIGFFLFVCLFVFVLHNVVFFGILQSM